MRAVSRAAVLLAAGVSSCSSPRPHRCSAWGTTPRRSQLAGARPRDRPGRHRAAADLLVRPPDPRPLARRLGLPARARGVQPDLRRRAAPRHADRCRRLLLARPRRARRPWVRDAPDARGRDRRGAGRLVRLRRPRSRPRSSGASEDAIASTSASPGRSPSFSRSSAAPLARRPAPTDKAMGDLGLKAAVDGGRAVAWR